MIQQQQNIWWQTFLTLLFSIPLTEATDGIFMSDSSRTVMTRLGLSLAFALFSSVWLLSELDIFVRQEAEFASFLSCCRPAAWHEVWVFCTNNCAKLGIIVLAAELHQMKDFPHHPSMLSCCCLLSNICLCFCLIPLKLWTKMSFMYHKNMLNNPWKISYSNWSFKEW